MKRLKTFVKKITWLPGIEHGWGNGYVILPEEHPYYGKEYDDINVDVHGGLTFSESAKDLDWPEIDAKDKKGWVIGFDTAHYGDSIYTWPIYKVEEELKRLAKQLTINKTEKIKQTK